MGRIKFRPNVPGPAGTDSAQSIPGIAPFSRWKSNHHTSRFFRAAATASAFEWT